jgi:hypothetical protein
VTTVDVGFILAVAALGWGLSLLAYRPLARQRGWPMGAWQANRPQRPAVIGAACILAAALFALARAYGGHAGSAAAIVLFGVAWAIFWIGFLRVGAQSALLLGPLATALLLMRWLG